MTQSDDGTSEVFIDAVAERIRSKLPKAQAELAEPFARKYLSQVDPEDLSERTIDDLYGAVLSHLNLNDVNSLSSRYSQDSPDMASPTCS